MGYAGFFGKILTQVRMVTPGLAGGKGRVSGRGRHQDDRRRAGLFLSSSSRSIEKSAGQGAGRSTVERGGSDVDLKITPRREGKVGKIGVLQTA